MIPENMDVQAKTVKEQGNQLFKEGKWEEAISCYTKALTLNPKGGSETAVYHNNRAACYLKLAKYKDAVIDCSKVLDFQPNDPKALFRKCQALEQMEHYEEAYKDAMKLMKVDPKNAAIQPVLRRLNPIIQEKIKQQHSTDSKVTQMFDLAFDQTADDLEKRKTAANNLVVLAREPAGAQKILLSGGLQRLLHMLETEKDRELQVTANRTIACLASHTPAGAMTVLETITLKKIMVYMSVDQDDTSTSMAHILQRIIMTITDLERIKEQKDKHEKERLANPGAQMRPWHFTFDKMDEEGMKTVDVIFPALISMVNNAKVSAYGRDNALELMLKFVTRKDGCGWPKKFIEAGGIVNLLETAGTIPEHKTLPLTRSTRMHVSLLLQNIYDDLLSDQERELYRKAVDDYFNDMFGDNIMDSKVEAIMALAALLQGPFDVGNHVLTRQGIMEIILAMADSGNIIQTKYAVEALVHATSKKDRCSFVIKQATPILKQLYQSENDAVKVRALVGLCKLGSFGGSDASLKPLAEGSTQTLAKACRRFLCNPTKDVDLRRWAVEGLAYLTLDAEVKEDLVNDTASVQSMVDLAKIQDKNILYPVVQVFVNVSNSYDKPDVDPEMVELAKFSKHHVPEEHEKDKEPFVTERRQKLVKAGIVNALVAFSSADSDNSKELLARVYLSVAMIEEHRGLLVQQGGAKSLIPLSLSGTEIGKAIASQALAKIAISMNPEIAFPGQRACEVVRPILQLLNIQKTSLQNYEALLALTNLSSMSESVRKRILKERGLANIEHYCYEEHEELRRAATECLCNLTMSEEVVERFKDDNDRVKLMVLFSGEEDEGLVRAASGALAMISHEPTICHKIMKCTTQWFDILQGLIASDKVDIQYRGVYIVRNMLIADKEICKTLVESTMLEVLMAVTKLQDPMTKKTREVADEALEKAVEWDMIKPFKT